MRLVQSSPERPQSTPVTHGIGTSLKQVAVRGGDSAKIRIAALLCRPYWFESVVLAQERNLSDLAIMNRELTARGTARSPRGSSRITGERAPDRVRVQTRKRGWFGRCCGAHCCLTDNWNRREKR